VSAASAVQRFVLLRMVGKACLHFSRGALGFRPFEVV
jgi:hypothetical protein